MPGGSAKVSQESHGTMILPWNPMVKGIFLGIFWGGVLFPRSTANFAFGVLERPPMLQITTFACLKGCEYCKVARLLQTAAFASPERLGNR